MNKDLTEELDKQVLAVTEALFRGARAYSIHEDADVPRCVGQSIGLILVHALENITGTLDEEGRIRALGSFFAAMLHSHVAGGPWKKDTVRRALLLALEFTQAGEIRDKVTENLLKEIYKNTTKKA